MKTKLTLALAAILTGTAFGSMPASMPEFKNAKQLAEWRAEVTAQSVKESSAEQEHAFYTGKPYVESSDSYAFKYRSYNPELARWTSEDPSGFPDGANNHFYAPNPMSGFDPLGLASDHAIVGAVVEGWKSLGFTYSERLAEHSLSMGDDRDALSDEIDSIKSAQEFTDKFNRSAFEQTYAQSGPGTYGGTVVVQFSGDLGYSFGKIAFEYTCNAYISSQNHYSYEVDFWFNDIYDFAPSPNNAAINAFIRLQSGGMASIYNTSGQFGITYE